MNALRTISRRILAAAVGEKSTHGQQEHDFADNVGLAAVKKKEKKDKKVHTDNKCTISRPLLAAARCSGVLPLWSCSLMFATTDPSFRSHSTTSVKRDLEIALLRSKRDLLTLAYL